MLMARVQNPVMSVRFLSWPQKSAFTTSVQRCLHCVILKYISYTQPDDSRLQTGTNLK